MMQTPLAVLFLLCLKLAECGSPCTTNHPWLGHGYKYTGTINLPIADGYSAGLTCDTNYSPYSGGSTSIKCLNGTWTNPTQICGANCASQPSIVGVSASCSSSSMKNNKFCSPVPTCASGYGLSGGTLATYCDNGSWSITGGGSCLPQCTVTPTDPTFSGTCATSLPGAVCTGLTCNSGYTLTGSLSQTCTQSSSTSSSWVSAGGICHAKCLSPPSEVGSVPNLAVGSCSSAVHGGTCLLSCASGYSAGDSMSMTCTDGVWSSFAGSCNAPIVTSVSQTCGSSTGCLISIAGTYLGSTGTVTVGSFSCNVGSWSTGSGGASTISCLVRGEGTSLPVSVQPTSLLSWSSDCTANPALCVNYPPPTFNQISSGSSTLGNEEIQITGQFLGVNPTVTIGGSACTNVTANAVGNLIECLTPAGQGIVSVSISVVGYSSLSATYLYATPVVTSSSPQGAAAGTRISIYGANFGTDATAVTSITVGGSDCTSIQLDEPHTTLSCLLPEWTNGNGMDYPILVTVGGLTNTWVPENGYNYVL